MTLTSQADRAFTTPTSSKAVELGVDISISSSVDKVEILVGDVTKLPNAKSGRDMNAMAPVAVPVQMKEYITFAPTRLLAMPKGWVIPKRLADSQRLAAAIDRLRWHGIKIQEIADETQLPVERFSIVDLTKQERPFQGHNEARLRYPERDRNEAVGHVPEVPALVHERRRRVEEERDADGADHEGQNLE